MFQRLADDWQYVKGLKEVQKIIYLDYLDEISKMIRGIIVRVLIYQATCLNIVLWWIDVLEVTTAF